VPRVKDRTFLLGVVTVEVTTSDGRCFLEDWDPRDSDEAEEYARETSACGDVLSVRFSNVRPGRELTFPTHQLKRC
jgi:hypothetical protein